MKAEEQSNNACRSRQKKQKTRPLEYIQHALSQNFYITICFNNQDRLWRTHGKQDCFLQ